MSDIVERLRNRIHDAPIPTEYLLDEAADEIERLREAYLCTLNKICAELNEAADAIERLREESK